VSIAVVVADDFPVLRRAMAAELERDPNIAVVAEAEDGIEALELAGRLEPDVVVLDLRMPGLDGQQVLERLHATRPDVGVVIVTAVEHPRALREAVAGGAAGFLSKRCTGQELRDAVVAVHAGGSQIAPELRPLLIEARSDATRSGAALDRRERRILALVAAGATDGEIALELGVSDRMVRKNLERVHAKIGVRRRAQLIRWAVEHREAL
jgi:DNA-binding NarL/FixJ family response regulator